ncbi:MAG: nucleotidyltransferase family protein [Armatimonadetes bacterium]|nr:nucleotidyltransferase family protein [Armatimonadota bacterium]
MSRSEKVDVILPASGRIGGEFAREAGVTVKALIEFGGETMLGRTVDLLRETGRADRIVVIGPGDLARHPAVRGADAVLPEADSGPANILRGLQWLHEAHGERFPERVLILTTDLPFLTGPAVTGFLDACPNEVEVGVPIIEREAFRARFPKTGNAYVRLREGHWTLGCAFLVNPEILVARQGHIQRAFDARKSRLSMARLLGLGFLLRYLTRRLTVGQIENKCQEVLGCTGGAVYGCAPELAFDIDLPEEYRYAAALLADEVSRRGEQERR